MTRPHAARAAGVATRRVSKRVTRAHDPACAWAAFNSQTAFGGVPRGAPRDRRPDPAQLGHRVACGSLTVVSGLEMPWTMRHDMERSRIVVWRPTVRAIDRLTALEKAWGVGQFDPDPESIPGQVHWLISEVRRLLRAEHGRREEGRSRRDRAASTSQRPHSVAGRSVPADLEGDLLTVSEAAEFLSISPSSMRRLIHSGDVQSVRIGVRTTRVRLSDLDDYAKTLP
jgi:excisionase family DNA binding protein